MAETKVGILLEVVDRASQGLKNVAASAEGVKGKLEGMKPTFQKIATAGTVAFGAISAVAVKAVKDYQEVEVANKMLEHAVLNVSKASKAQLSSLNDVISATEKKGVVDADALKVGVAQLSTFGLTTDMVTKLTPALADLAVNQNGVNVSGEQMSDTANIIAKALNGQFGILEKSGIRFTELQQKQIQFGTDSERSAALIAGFNQNLKFTNELAAQTGAGGLAIMRREIGNISEGLGKALSPALAKAAQAIQPIVEKISAWVEANPELASKIVMVAGAVAGLVAVIGGLGLILPAIIAGFTFLISPVGLIVLGILALIAAGVYLYAHWNQVKAWAVEIWNSIAQFFSGIWQSITNALTTAWNAIASFFEAIWNVIKIIFLFAVGGIFGAVIAIFDAMGINIFDVFNAIGQFFSEWWDRLVEQTTTALQFLQNLWNTVWSAIRDFLTPVIDALKLVIGGLWTWIKTTFEKAVKPVSDLWKNMWNGLTTAAQSAWESVKNTVKGSINWIIEKVNFLIRSINEIARKGAGVIGFSAPQIPEVPFLAKGGIVTRPTLAMIGEGNEPEAVIPLSRLAGAGGNNINIYITGTFMSEDAALKMGDLIIDKLRRNLKI